MCDVVRHPRGLEVAFSLNLYHHITVEYEVSALSFMTMITVR